MVDLYNVNDGLTGRDGGPYLDQIEQERAEEQRAKVEKREPDLDNPGGVAGTVYATAEQLLAHRTDTYTPAQSEKDKRVSEVALDAVIKDSSNSLKVAFAAPDNVNDEEEDKEEDEDTSKDKTPEKDTKPVTPTHTSTKPVTSITKK